MLTFKRVIYGKASTKPSMREYSIGIGAPVGTKKEIFAWAKGQGIKRSEIKFTEQKPKYDAELIRKSYFGKR